MIIMRPAPGTENHQPRNAQSKTQRSPVCKHRRPAEETGVSKEGRKGTGIVVSRAPKVRFQKRKHDSLFFLSEQGQSDSKR